MNDTPNMETFLEEHWQEISEDLKEKVFWNSCGMDQIIINPAILQIMGVEIAILIPLFLEASYIASTTYGNPYDDGYYASKAERKLDEMDKYHEDDEGNIWFTFPLKTIQQKTLFPLSTIKKHIKFLQSIKFLQIQKEKRFEKTFTWYHISKSAHTGMIYYCGWKSRDVLPWKK